MLLLSVFHFDNDILLLLLLFDNQLGRHVKIMFIVIKYSKSSSICKGLYEGVRFYFFWRRF